MKKIAIIAVLLITAVFYISMTSFNVVDYFRNEGYIFTDNEIQTNLYKGNLKNTVEPNFVDEDQEILERWGSYYADVNGRKKINTVYPMYISDGAGIQFLDYNNDLYDSDLNLFDGYKGLNINNGEAYNNSFERADTNEYTLARLNNNLYINVQDMEVETIANKYDIKLNSNLYMTPDFINYAYYNYGVFKFDTIDDINEDSIVKIGSMEIKYGDLLLGLGETAIEEDSNIPNQNEQKQNNEDYLATVTYKGKAKINNTKKKTDSSTNNDKNNGTGGNGSSGGGQALVPTRATIYIDKKINSIHDKPDIDETFTFNIHSNDKLISSTNIFGENKGKCEILFENEGSYNYLISEYKYDYENYTFDETVYPLQINVGSKNGKLVINKILINNEETDTATFTNSYDHTKQDGEVSDIIKIKNSFSDDSDERILKKNFKFSIINASNNAPIPSNKRPLILDEGISSSSLKFTKDGTYRYMIKEDDLGYLNYVFDNKIHIIEFNVEKIDDELRVVNKSIDGIEIKEDELCVEFINKYNGSENGTIEVNLNVTNNITDSNQRRIKNKVFTYKIERINGTILEPKKSEIKITDINTDSFNFVFNKEGIYEYEISQLEKIYDKNGKELDKELISEDSNSYHYYVDDDGDGNYDTYKLEDKDVNCYYKLDNSKYRIKISVEKRDDGKLYADKQIIKIQNNETEQNNIIFRNVYFGDKTSGKHEYHVLPKDPEDPDTASGDVNPEEQHEHEEEPIEPIVPEWKMPSVTVVGDDKYVTTTYTVSTKIKVDDTSNSIQDGRVTYEIILNEGENKGKTYKRVSFSAEHGEHEYTINGLRANSKYIIKGYFRYRDDMDKLVSTPIYFDDGSEIVTKDIGELGSIYVTPIDMTEAQILSNQINIPHLSFQIEDGKSSKDALSSVSIVTVELTSEDRKVDLYRLTNDNLTKLINGQTISYTTKNNLVSGKKYSGKIVCYDLYGNLINVINDSFESHTCKKLPKTTVKLTYPSLDKVSITATVDTSLGDEYVKEYNNLRIVLTDSNGEVVPFDGVDYKNIVSGETFTLENLGLNKTYNLTILLDCDNDDGQGITTKQIYSKPFVTGRLSELGNLNLNVSNLTKNKYSTDSVNDLKNLATNAVLGIQINRKSTKADLLNFVDELYVTFSHDTDRYTYKLSDEELSKLLSNDDENNTVEIDVKDKFISEGLLSNTEYAITYQAKYAPENDEKLDIGVRTTLNRIKTNRMPIITKIYSLDAYSGFITSKFKVEDIDNIIEGDSYILRVVKVEDNGKLTIVGSYNINKNEDFELNMFADAESSTDGLPHIIEGNSNYIFRFIAKEANLDSGVETGYLFHEEAFSTKQSLQGDIYLIELEEETLCRSNELPEEYRQVEYIESVGNQYFDLGYTVKDNTSATIKYMANDISGNQAVFGGSWAGNKFLLNIQSNRWYYHAGGTNSGITPSTKYPDIITVSKKYYIVNGIKYNVSTDTYQGNLKLLGFGSNSYNAKGKLYSFVLYEDNKIVHDYIPVIRTSDNVAGLYDVKTKSFLQNKGTGKFLYGKIIEENVYNTSGDLYRAKLGINLIEDISENDWYKDNVAYVNVYRHTFVGGKENVTLDNENPIEIHYEGEGGNFELEYPVLIDNDLNNFYSFKLFYTLDLKDKDDISIELDNTQFNTGEPIYTISNIDEFFAVGGSTHKFVVIDDIYYNATSSGRDAADVHWKSAAPLYADIDFQGFSFNLSGTGPVIYQTSKYAKIENMVLNIDNKTLKTTSRTYGSGAFISNNYGTISNVKMKYAENQYETYDEETIYKYGAYWTTKPDGEGVTHYIYNPSGTLAYDNYGLIENFAIDVSTPVISSGYSGFVTNVNHSGGTVRNGYLYSSLTDENGKVVNNNKIQLNIYGSGGSNSYFGIGVGYNQTNAVVENIYALGDINLVSTTCNGTGIICGNNVGIVRNCYSVGNTVYNSMTYPNINMKTTTYGPAIGTSGNYVNQNIYYISDNTYMDANSTKYNSVASIMSLRNRTWQNTILNTNSEKGFIVDELIEANCYPQVVYTSDVMPQQDYIELMDAPNLSAVDLIYSYAYDFGSNKNIDLLFEDYESKNELTSDIGTTVWDYEINDKGIFSNTQRFIALVSNKSELPIDSIKVSGLETKVIANINDGTGITTVLGYCYNPIKAYSEYNVLKLVIKDYDLDDFTEVPLDTGRKLFVEYYRAIEGVEDWNEHLHKKTDKEVDQNFILLDDIDFNNEYYLNEIYVNDIYTGKFNGNDKQVSNTKFTVFDYAKEGIVKASPVGLFKQINGSVYNLNIDNIHFEGGKYAGVLTGELGGGSVDNVFISNSSVVGGNYTGGLVGYTLAGTTISNSGVKNVKISSNGTTDSSDVAISVGGIIGIQSGLTTIDRCYAQNIYIENWYITTTTGLGGIIGWNSSGSNYSTLTNSYATGVIIGAADGMGGIYGVDQSISIIDNCYSDVDLICYNGNAGGLVGRSINNNQTISNCITFGNVISGNILDDPNDSRINSVDLINVDTNRFLSGYSFDEAILDLRYRNESGDICSKSDSLTHSGTFTRTDYSSNINAATYSFKDDYLPLLTDNSGNVLYGQDYELIDENNKVIELQSLSVNGNKINVVIKRDRSVKIEGIETDYCFYEDVTNTNTNGINSFSHHKALEFSNVEKTTNDMSIIPIDTFTYTISNFNSAYDLYRITAIKYSDETGIHYLKVNRTLDLAQQYKEIDSFSKWNNLFHNSKSFAENIRVTGDIDFSSNTDLYNEEGNVNVTINRLEGRIKDDSYNYLDYKNNQNIYYCLSNALINTDKNSEINPWLYNGWVGLIKTTLTNCSNLVFNNIDVLFESNSGVINLPIGNVENIIFDNCEIESTGPSGSSGYIGLLSICNTNINNVFIRNASINSKTVSTGILGGYYVNGKLRHIVNGIVIDDSVLNSSNTHSGSLFGQVSNGGRNLLINKDYNALDLNYSAVISNCDITNVSINSTSTYAGGLAGLANYSAYIQNCNIVDSSIKGTQYVGGITGYGGSNNVYLNEDYVYNCKVWGTTSYTGGVSGIYGRIWNNVVEDCEIASQSYVGGLWGRGQTWIDRTNQDSANNADVCGWVKNSRIYGSERVGGLIGYSEASIDALGFVENCEIYGNTYVGGAIGYINRYWVGSPYVSDTIISPIKSNKYSIQSSISPSYFGGLVGYGGRASGFVENCVIGSQNTSYVGGIQGEMDYYESATAVQKDAYCKDSVVYGYDYVGGLFGKVITISESYDLVSFNDYSNAYVVGHDYVAGIAGMVSGFKKTVNNKDTYLKNPYLQYSYFTGSLKASERASAFYGKVVGNTSNLSMAGLVSMPYSIYGKDVQVVLIDGNLSENSFYYNYSDLENESADLKLSVADQTKIYINGNDTITDMEQLLKLDKYANHTTTDYSEIEEDFTNGAKTDRKFIYLYSKSNNELDPDGTGIYYVKDRSKELPTEYKQIEYIKATGNQYINLNYTVKDNTSAYISYSSTDYSGSQAVFGGAWSGNQFLLNIQSNKWYYHANGVSSGTAPSLKNPDEIYVYKNKYIVNGKEFAVTKDSFKGKLKLLGLGANSYNAKGKLYSFKLYEDNKIVHDYIPVVRNSDGDVGLYDVIDKNYLGSSSANKFVAGDEVVKPSYDGEANYIANGINSKSLTGPTKLGSLNWYYDFNLIMNDYMPIDGISDVNPERYWDSVDGDGMNYVSKVSNPISNEYNYISVKQGVNLPFTGKFETAYTGMYNLYTNYDKYLHGQLNYDEFVDDSNVGNVDSTIELIDAYTQDINTLNIDISDDLLQLYNVANRNSELPDGFEQLQYIESTGTQYINLGNIITSDTSATIEYMPTSISGNQAIFGGSWAGNKFLLDIQSSRWYFHGGGHNSGITPSTTKPSIITVSKKLFNVNGNEIKANDSYKGELKIFGLASNSYNARGRLYSFKIYEKDELVHDYIPARRTSDGTVGLYDLKKYSFFTNDGTGYFVAGGGLPTIKVELEGNDTPIIESPIDKRTFSFDYDFNSNIKITVSYTNASNNYVTRTETFAAKNLRNRVTSFNNKLFFIGEDENLFVSDSDANIIYINEEVANVFGKYALTKSGTIFDISGKTPTSVSVDACGSSDPLYNFSLSDGIYYYTYGTYSYSSANSTTSLNRFFNYDGNLLMLRDSMNGSYNPYFKNNQYEAYLRDDGVLISLGNKDLIDYLNKAKNRAGNAVSFTNSEISKITSNFEVNNSVIGFTYTNGKTVGYDISKENAILLFETASDPTLLSTSDSKPSLLTFLSNSLSNMFAIPESSEITEERNETENIVRMMTTSRKSVSKVVEELNESGELSEILNSNELNFVLANTAKEESFATINEELIDNAIANNTLLSFNMSEEGVESYNLKPNIDGVTDANEEIMNFVSNREDREDNYVLVYNEETKEFDIYTVDELIENPDNPVSVNYKVIDKSTLKSLYQAFDENNKDDAHGVTLYMVVAGAILVLTMGIAIGTKTK